MPVPNRQPQPRFSILLEALEILRNLGIGVTAGAVAAMLCFIGKGFVDSVFGKLFGLIFHKIAALTLLHIGLGPLAILGGILAVGLLTALWTNTFFQQHVQSQDNHFYYGLVCWALPMGAFALSLGTGFLALPAACWLAFGLGATANSAYLVIPSAKQGWEAWQSERALAAQQAPLRPHNDGAPAPRAPRASARAPAASERPRRRRASLPSYLPSYRANSGVQNQAERPQSSPSPEEEFRRWYPGS